MKGKERGILFRHVHQPHLISSDWVCSVYVYWPISSDWALYMSVDHIKLGLGVLFVYVQYVVGS